MLRRFRPGRVGSRPQLQRRRFSAFSSWSSAAPGRACPAAYRTDSAALRSSPIRDVSASTVYVIGGLYGNRHALQTILRMKREEELSGQQVELVFTGDFNFLNCDASSVLEVNEEVLRRSAIAGNVEVELAKALEGELSQQPDCGCGYPAFVSDAFVERSNRIMRKLQLTARRTIEQPKLLDERERMLTVLKRLSRLPKQLRLRFASASGNAVTVAVLHGIVLSLVGRLTSHRRRFGLAVRLEVRSRKPVCSEARFCLEPDGSLLLACLQHSFLYAQHVLGSADDIATALAVSGVDAVACTHTCLPVAARFGERLVFNNGERRNAATLARSNSTPQVPVAWRTFAGITPAC